MKRIVVQHLLIYFIITPYFYNILKFIKHVYLFDFHKSILSYVEIDILILLMNELRRKEFK